MGAFQFRCRCAVGKQCKQSQKRTASGLCFLHPGSRHIAAQPQYGGAGDAGVWFSLGPATWLRAETAPATRNMSVRIWMAKTLYGVAASNIGDGVQAVNPSYLYMAHTVPW